MTNQLELKVFPSEQKTITVIGSDDIYGGAHKYEIENCIGFNDGKTQYEGGKQTIQFVHKADDGTMTPGLQSEQLVYVLMDRHQKLNARFPSAENERMLEGLQMFIDACESRVKERMNRGVMGDLKK